MKGLYLMESKKTRSDKKRAVAPLIGDGYYELVSRIGYICDLPLKAVGEMIIREGIKSKKLVGEISKQFRRQFTMDGNHLYLGQLERPAYRTHERGECKRLYMKFYSFEYERFSDLAYALDCSCAAAVGLLIKSSLVNKEIMYQVLSQGIIRNLDASRIDQLKRFCRHLDSQSDDHYITLPAAVSHALYLGLSSQKKLNKTIDEWNRKVN